MSRKYVGGIVTANPSAPTATSAKGIWTLDQASNFIKQNIWPRSPDAPVIGTATVSALTASVPFTVPANTGSTAITSYRATSTAGGFTATSATSPISVTGLTANTSFTFSVTATNGAGTSAPSAVSNSITTADIPGAPTIGTATISGVVASVPFTAPASNGGATITTYTATSSPGGVTGTLSQAGSGTVTVSGLTGGTSYTFTVTATNAIGTGAASAASNSVTAVVVGQQEYTTAGTYNWVAPAGVTSVSILAVGAGAPGVNCYFGCPYGARAGGGGGLGYLNSYSVTPGNSYAVKVGAGTDSLKSTNESYFVNNTTVKGGGAGGVTAGCYSLGGTRCGVASGGNKGGNASSYGGGSYLASGGGASGFSGSPESGGRGIGSPTCNAISGVGGGGGGGNGRGGGGVGLYGQGASGAGALAGTNSRGCGGSGGQGGGTSTTSALYGGGAGQVGSPNGGRGAVRIIWPGGCRQYPSTRTADE